MTVTAPVKISLIILFITLLGLGGFTAYKIVSSAVDNTNYLEKGDSYFSTQQYSNALSAYEKYEAKNPTNVSVYQKIAKVYEVKSRFKDAIDVLKKGLIKVTSNADLSYEIAEDASFLIYSDPTLSIVATSNYLDAAKSDKYKNIATYKAARLISQKADTDSLNTAKDLYTSLPNYQPAQYELALYNIDQPDQALSLINAAQKVSPTEGQDSLLADFSSWDAFSKEVVTELNLVKQDIAGNKSISTIADSKGYVAYKTNRCEFGINFLKTAITESEKEVFYPQARLLIGECYQRLKSYNDAKTYLEPVLQKNSDSIDVRLILRQVYKGLGDYTNMKKMYGELITLDGQNIQTRLDYANDLELISDYPNSALQYSWLGQNLTNQSILGNTKNTDYSLNQKYLIKAYEVYAYKVKDYPKALDTIQSAITKNPSYIDSKIGDELTSWINYQQNLSDKTLRDSVYTKAKQLSNIDALYHTALIAKDLKDNSTAKTKALEAYNKDDLGYIEPLAAELVNQL